MILKVFQYALVLLLITLIMPVAADQRASYQQSVEDSKNKIKRLDKTIQQDKRKRQTIKQRLARRNKKIKELNKKISTLQAQIVSTTSQLKDLQSELVVQRRNTQEQKLILAEQIRLAYQMGSYSDIELLLNQNDPTSFERMKVYADYFAKAHQSRITGAIFSVRKLAQSRLRAATLNQSLLDKKKQLAKSRKSEVLERQSKQRLIAQLGSNIDENSSEVEKLQKNIQKLQKLVIKLDKKAKEKAKTRLQGKGLLPWPTLGKLKAHFGKTKTNGKLKWNGIFIAAAQDSEIRSVADGEVVYADWLNGFGLLLIVNHGDGVMSLYGNCENLLSDIGQTIKKGQLIATIGNSSALSESGLYFEIRQNARTVDPLLWISSKMYFAK